MSIEKEENAEEIKPKKKRGRPRKKIDENQETVNQNKKDELITEIKLEKIENEIKKNYAITDYRKNKIYKRIFRNILIAIVVVIYFIFLMLGYMLLNRSIYLRCIQICSILLICLTIAIFEIAYKKRKDEIALHGIEALAIAISSLITIYLQTSFKEKYINLLNAISMIFVIYFITKSIIMYSKMKKKALKKLRKMHIN